jgi:hypothetical protein
MYSAEYDVCDVIIANAHFCLILILFILKTVVSLSTADSELLDEIVAAMPSNDYIGLMGLGDDSKDILECMYISSPVT